MSMDGMVLRGVSYRTKTSRQGMPWAVDGSGFLGCPQKQNQSWPALYLHLLGTAWQPLAAQFGEDWSPDSLFVMWTADEFVPLSYSQALRRLRMLLAFFSNDFVSADSYTLHSAKCTFLSWMKCCCAMKAAVCRVIIGRGVHSYIVEMTLGVLWMPSGASLQGLGKAGSRPLQLPGVRKPRCMLRQWTLICGSVSLFSGASRVLSLPEVFNGGEYRAPQTEPSRAAPIYESDSEAEGADQLEEVVGPPGNLTWLRSGQGAVRVAVGVAQESGGAVMTARAACGAFLSDPACMTQPPVGARLCQHQQASFVLGVSVFVHVLWLMQSGFGTEYDLCGRVL